MKPSEFDSPLGRTLSEQVLARLRQAIVNGELAPGRTPPTRPACRVARRQQYARARSHRRPRSRAARRPRAEPRRAGPPADPPDVPRVRARSIACCSKPATSGDSPSSPKSDYAKIAALNADLRACCKGEDYGPAFDIDQSIHEVVFRAANNNDLTALLASLKSRVHRMLNLRFPKTHLGPQPRPRTTASSGPRSRATSIPREPCWPGRGTAGRRW